MGQIDAFLDRLTTYKLMLYLLYILAGWAIIVSFFHKVPFLWHEILLSGALLVAVCYVSNWALSKYFDVPTNTESYLITALILALIMSPATSASGFLILAATGVIAMASKYIFVLSRWHVFNPAAFGTFIAGTIFNHFPSWWVGTGIMMPVIIAGGLLVARKMKRFIMVTAFLIVYLAILSINVYLNQSFGAIWQNIHIALFSSPLLFLAFIMLVEPLTSPRFMRNYMAYAPLVALLYGYNNFHISPEESLLIGNAFSYLVEPNRRLPLAFMGKQQEAEGIESFVFSGKSGLKYSAGQYLEWTLPVHKTDSRGNRRYLTISSSPTEKDLMFTVRLPNPSSSFKQTLQQLKEGDPILAAQLAGSFVLPKSERQKLAFIAGGVGITPFRSMVKYLVDFKQERDIVLLYSASRSNEFAFKNLFKEAEEVGVDTEYLVTDPKTNPLSKQLFAEKVPDYEQRTFYISGPYGFVQAAEGILAQLKVPKKQIVTDYFPGYG